VAAAAIGIPLVRASYTTSTFNVSTKPCCIVFDDDNGWVTNSIDSTVTKLSNLGSTLGTYSTGTAPVGVIADRSNNV
jgi:hypothetical protein